MDSENNYDIVPVNNLCDNVIHHNVTVSSPGSDTSYSNQNVTNVSNQYDANGQYDNVDDITVKPLYGGILKNVKANILFTIKFRNKIVNIESLNEESAIKKFLDNKIYKKDHLLEIIYKNKSSLYIVKNSYKNKFKKIN
jgi:hypothetical protein